MRSNKKEMTKTMKGFLKGRPSKILASYSRKFKKRGAKEKTPSKIFMQVYLKKKRKNSRLSVRKQGKKIVRVKD